MSTYMRNSYEHSMERKREDAARKQAAYRARVAADKARTPLDTESIATWTPYQWAEFERRFTPRSWRLEDAKTS